MKKAIIIKGLFLIVTFFVYPLLHAFIKKSSYSLKEGFYAVIIMLPFAYFIRFSKE